VSDRPSFKRRPLSLLVTAHWLAQVGLGLVLTAIVTWLFLLVVHLRGGQENPYIGIALFGAVPLVLLAGVILTPIGLWRGRKRLRERVAGEPETDRRIALRRLAVFFAATAIVNLAIGTQVTYRAVHHMESRQFCGSCHVMEPEFTAFSPGPHAGLRCVDCHVGEGAEGWIESKLQGTRQLWHVLTDSVPQPIPAGISTGRMVSSSETCESCHWKERLGAVHLNLVRRYMEDETNTPETTVLTMHVGGMEMGGIHGAHCAPGAEVRFVANDPLLQDIPWVEYTDPESGDVRTYVRADADPADFEETEPVTMQCIDCHNRAAHAFQPPDRALDEAFTLGRVPSSLPWLKKQGMETLTAEYESREEALEAIPAALASYYRSEHPDVWESRSDDVEAAGEAIADIWARNVFPEHGVTWGTYPNNLGHEAHPGCYRCHGGDHETAEGETLTAECYKCHAASAVAETDPEILHTLGLQPVIDGMRRE